MIGIIQRFGMASKLSHRKITVFLLYHKKYLWKIVIDININSNCTLSDWHYIIRIGTPNRFN